MKPGALSLQHAPAIGVPLRFFLTVPLFGALAAGIVLVDGGQLFQSRWAPASLAAVHALTLGYVTLAMLGALFQMLPVVMEVFLPRAAVAAAATHLLVAAGTLCLLAAFLLRSPWLFTAAIALLAPPLLLFGAAVALAVFRAGKPGITARAAQLAAVALLVTTALGAWLAAGHADPVMAPARALTDSHAAWGLAGWVFVLVAGVSTQVIPMFLTTPPYPAWISRAPVWLVIPLLVAAGLSPWPAAGRLAGMLLGGLMLAWAGVTLALLVRRRRTRFDVTDAFWRLGMLCLLASAGAGLYARAGGAVPGWLPVLAGLLLIAGFAVSVINGMLYKIVPFLVWLHLRMPAVSGDLPPGHRYYTPNIHEVIGGRWMLAQFLLHAGGLLLLGLAVFHAAAAPAGAVFMLLSSLLLLANLVHAVRLYHRYASRPVAMPFTKKP